MSTWLDDAWADVKGAAHTCWPEVNSIWRVTQIERIDWKDLIERGELTPPWCVIQLPTMRQVPGRGAGQVVFQANPAIYYIDKNHGADIGATIEAKLAAMLEYLVSHAFSGTLVENSLAVEMSEESPVNRAMLEQQMPYSAGSVSFGMLCGFIANT